MKDLLSKLTTIRWTTWLLIAMAVFLLFMAFRSCNNLPSHKPEKKSSDSAAAAYADSVAVQKRLIIDLQYRNSDLQKSLDSANQQLNIVRKDAAARVMAVRQTLTSGVDAAKR